MLFIYLTIVLCIFLVVVVMFVCFLLLAAKLRRLQRKERVVSLRGPEFERHSSLPLRAGSGGHSGGPEPTAKQKVKDLRGKS